MMEVIYQSATHETGSRMDLKSLAVMVTLAQRRFLMATTGNKPRPSSPTQAKSVHVVLPRRSAMNDAATISETSVICTISIWQYSLQNIKFHSKTISRALCNQLIRKC
jgi:hypothetical protein